MATRGLPVTKRVMFRSIKRYLDGTGAVVAKFKDNIPGDKWYSSFLKRHKHVIKKNTLFSGKARVTEPGIKKWFRLMKLYIKEQNLLDILSDPSRIFCADEIGFELCGGKATVSCARDSTYYYNIVPYDETKQITVMAAFAADGWSVPPLVVYPYSESVPSDIVLNMPPSWAICAAPSGLMNGDLFYDWLVNHFHPQLLKKNVKFPVILYIDGNRSHLAMDASELCDSLNIIIISIPPNTTHLLQPADVGVFQPLKAGWSQQCKDWLTNHGNDAITLLNFSGLLREVLEYYAQPSSVAYAFRVCGIYPYNAGSVNYANCVDSRTVPKNNSLFIEINPFDAVNESSSKCVVTTSSSATQNNTLLHGINFFNANASPSKCLQPKFTHTPQNDSFLSLLELKIESMKPGLLNSFETSFPGNWNGQTAAKGLYDLWKDSKSMRNSTYNGIDLEPELSKQKTVSPHNEIEMDLQHETHTTSERSTPNELRG